MRTKVMPLMKNFEPKKVESRDTPGKWFMFPDLLPMRRFKGFENREDETQNRGAFVVGQNVTFNSARIPTLRQGFEVLGTEQTDEYSVRRAWRYETRSGVQFLLKYYNTRIDFFLIGVSTDWSLLLDNLQPNLEMGFANIGKKSEATMYTLFCNGQDPWYKFSGAYGLYASDFNGTTSTKTATTIGFVAGAPFPATITDSGSGFVAAGFVAGDIIQVTGSASNNGFYTIQNVAPGVITLDDNDVLTTEAAGASVTITAQGKTITVSGSLADTLTTKGFDTSGSIVINGETITYTGIAGNSFLGASVLPTTPTVGDIIVQAPEVISSISDFKGNVIMAHDGRVHANLFSKKTIWNYSQLDDYEDWTAGNSDGDGGAKEVEFGGPITAFGKLNQVALCFKNRIIKTLSFNQVGTRLDSPVYTTLIPADDKGTTLGAINQRSTFSTPMGLVFVTPDKRLVLLTGVTANNQPQYLFLSDQIQPVMNAGVHDTATGICVDNIIWYAFKSSPESTFNDVVLRGDMTRQSQTSDGKTLPVEWDTPYVGWNVNDFTVHFDSVLGKNIVVWHSSINSNSYKIIDEKADNLLPYTGVLRSWAETFDIPQIQKKIDYVFIEVKMTENTELECVLLYDEDGISGREEYTLLGSSTNNSFYADTYNPYGASPYGTQKMGSNPENPSLRKYRFIIETPNNTWFYNISAQFATTLIGNDFEIIRFGYHLNKTIAQNDTKLLTGV